MRAWMLLFLLGGCSAEVGESCQYEKVETGRAESYTVWFYAFCDGVDPAVGGSCEGGNVVLERVEHINTGRGHMYCAFKGPEGAAVTARVECQCQ